MSKNPGYLTNSSTEENNTEDSASGRVKQIEVELFG
jgi:hypothetical protein